MASIAVVIPVYNRERLVCDAIESVLEQIAAVDEIVVVDDGSTDGTVEALRKYQGLVTVICQENKGVSAARNAGAFHATAEWLTFLDSDDVWLPHRIQTLKRDIEGGHFDVHLCGAEFVGEDYNFTFFENVGISFPEEMACSVNDPVHLASCSPQVGAVSVRRRVFVELGGFYEALSVAEDRHLMLRLSAGERGWVATGAIGLKVRHIPGSDSLLFRQIENSPLSVSRQRAKAFRHIVENESFDEAFRKRMGSYYSAALFAYSKELWNYGRSRSARRVAIYSFKKNPTLKTFVRSLLPVFFGFHGYARFQKRRDFKMRSDYIVKKY